MSKYVCMYVYIIERGCCGGVCKITGVPFESSGGTARRRPGDSVGARALLNVDDVPGGNVYTDRRE